MLFAEYNKLMNQRIMASATRLSTKDLTDDRGAFFKSVIGTLNHVLVGDIIWLKRFSTRPGNAKALLYVTRLDQPEALDTILFDNLNDLQTARAKIDEVIIDWISGLSEDDVAAYLYYRNMAGKPRKKLLASLISHLFLHQVHHRGQATTLISQSGVDFGDTDLLEIVDDQSA